MNLLDVLKLSDVPQGDMLDSPATAEIHKRIILGKPFLKALYVDFYRQLKARLPGSSPLKCVVELGSGAGFIKQVIPEVITSDVFFAKWIDRVFTAEKMPFDDESVDAFLMLNVFHHLPRVTDCLKEMNRCLKPGGKILLIEPANTPWQRFVTRHFHHELIDPHADWDIAGEGRLSAGNIALPWIVFVRDRSIFCEKFPQLKIADIRLHSPFRYILSGGLTYKSLVPSFSFPIIKALEFTFTPLKSFLCMFQTIEIVKN